MSNYQFVPANAFNQTHGFVTWTNGFTPEELDKICEYGDKLALADATIGYENATDCKIRSTQVGWIACNNDTAWLYDRLAHITRQLNAQFYGFDLYGFVEDMQYTVYNADAEGHYRWHVDMSAKSSAQRKLSVVVQLSDPVDYEGGDLQVHFETTEPQTVVKQRGMVCAFPSWVMHRVTPVTSGIRKTLVVWTAGPCFK